MWDYQRARYLIRTGQLDWQTLEHAGKALPKQKPRGHRPDPWFAEAI